MRAILIDPKARTITEMKMEDIDVEDFAGVFAILNGSVSEGYDCVACSADSTSALMLQDLPRDLQRYWFHIDADLPSSFPKWGKGLVFGVNKESYTTDARISIEELTQRITFTERAFKGVHWSGAQAIAVAPIIDGVNE